MIEVVLVHGSVEDDEIGLGRDHLGMVALDHVAPVGQTVELALHQAQPDLLLQRRRRGLQHGLPLRSDAEGAKRAFVLDPAAMARSSVR